MNSIASDFKTDGGISGQNEIAAAVLGEEKTRRSYPRRALYLKSYLPQILA